MQTKNSELKKIIDSMEVLGYQIDSIEMIPEGSFRTTPGCCLINIKASPLITVPVSESPEQA